MKKIIVLTFALFVMFSLSACKGSGSSANNAGSPAAESSLETVADNDIEVNDDTNAENSINSENSEEAIVN